MNRDLKKIRHGLVSVALIVLGFLLAMFFTPNGRAWFNKWRAGLTKADVDTSYESQKMIEDTLRSYVASYEADKITYESGKNSELQSVRDTAEAAKIRANRTAATYNEFYLKNEHVWKGNIPYDILHKLEYLE